MFYMVKIDRIDVFKLSNTFKMYGGRAAADHLGQLNGMSSSVIDTMMPALTAAQYLCITTLS